MHVVVLLAMAWHGARYCIGIKGSDNASQATAGRLGLRPRYRVAAVDAAPQPPDFPAFARGVATAAASGGRILIDQACTAVPTFALMSQSHRVHCRHRAHCAELRLTQVFTVVNAQYWVIAFSTHLLWLATAHIVGLWLA
jgi:hypothetical protein